ncbi:MAG: DUF4214 domain-containing protein [Beijerinckiaceae bacterium]
MTFEVDDNVYPATSVVYIEATWDGVTYTGSGVLVGRNDILTAAHVIYDYALGGLADSIEIFPSYDPDDLQNAVYSWEKVEYFPNFDPDSDGRLISGDFNRPTFAGSELDIALLSTSQPLGDLFGWMGIDWGFAGGNVGVIGHPSAYGRNMTYDSGTVVASPVDAFYEIRRDLEVNPGNSGGPVYYDYGNGPYVVGLVSTGSAAVDVGGHQYWLEAAMLANDTLLAVGRPAYVIDIARLYEAGLDRRFDAGGMNFWIDRFEAGQSLVQLGQVFLDSVEFTTRFGDDDAMSATQFATRMYLNVLNRNPDQGGLNFWVQKMNTGASREQLLVDFALSPENIAATGYLDSIRDYGGGVWNI